MVEYEAVFVYGVPCTAEMRQELADTLTIEEFEEFEEEYIIVFDQWNNTNLLFGFVISFSSNFGNYKPLYEINYEKQKKKFDKVVEKYKIKIEETPNLYFGVRVY